MCMFNTSPKVKSQTKDEMTLDARHSLIRHKTVKRVVELIIGVNVVFLLALEQSRRTAVFAPGMDCARSPQVVRPR